MDIVEASARHKSHLASCADAIVAQSSPGAHPYVSRAFVASERRDGDSASAHTRSEARRHGKGGAGSTHSLANAGAMRGGSAWQRRMTLNRSAISDGEQRGRLVWQLDAAVASKGG